MSQDPRKVKENDDRQQLLAPNNRFSIIAEEYITIQTHLSSTTHKNNRRYATSLSKINGNMPMN